MKHLDTAAFGHRVWPARARALTRIRGVGRVVVEVFFWTEPGAVLLEVVDHGQWRSPGPHAAGGGRGIEIMHRLVEAVLIHHDARGTRVLLRHSLPARPRTLLPDIALPAARVGDR